MTDGSIKDDGYYRMGVAPSYTRNDTKEIVTDNITGLMWQDNADAQAIKNTWNGAKAYCANLTLGGYSDWRLPSIEELEGIVDFGHSHPTIDPVFQNVAPEPIFPFEHSDYYWSSTVVHYYAPAMWVASLWKGVSGTSGTTNSVRCVRGGQ